MSLDRPDLSHVPEAVLAYIETLEAELERLRQRADEDTHEETPLEPSEPPTTINLVTISAQGMTKRTPRHFYLRQRRGGMGKPIRSAESRTSRRVSSAFSKAIVDSRRRRDSSGPRSCKMRRAWRTYHSFGFSR